MDFVAVLERVKVTEAGTVRFSSVKADAPARAPVPVILISPVPVRANVPELVRVVVEMFQAELVLLLIVPPAAMVIIPVRTLVPPSTPSRSVPEIVPAVVEPNVQVPVLLFVTMMPAGMLSGPMLIFPEPLRF